jgi:hypothetical protein
VVVAVAEGGTSSPRLSDDARTCEAVLANVLFLGRIGNEQDDVRRNSKKREMLSM